MKATFAILCVLALLVAAMCLTMTSCDSRSTPADTTADGNGDTTAPPADETVGDTTAEHTDESIAHPNEDTTEAPDTEAPTEEPVETEPPTPVLSVDLDLLADKSLNSYFTRGERCVATTVTDEAEGMVVRLTTKSINGQGSDRPSIYFNAAALAEADGNNVLADTTAYPYLILKVRLGQVNSRNFGLLGGISAKEINTSATLLLSRVDDEEDWQYVYFDLSDYSDPLRVFYLCFEWFAAKNGEYLDLAEMKLVATEEEAIALCGANVYPVETQSPEETVIKVVSYNIWAGSADFDIRADIFCDFVDTYRPDVVGMQEVSIRWRELLDTVVFNDSYAGVGELRIPGAEYDAIYYRKDKYDLIDTGTFWLSDTPDVMGSTHPDANAERICTWARLRDKVTGLEFVHVNTHLDNNGKNDSSTGRKVRLAQARVILEFIHSLGDVPVFLTGDFNQAHTSTQDNYLALYKNITGMSSFKASDGSEITVTLAEARSNAPDTVSPDVWASMVKYHQEGNAAYDPAHKPIDHIFYSPTTFQPLVYRNVYHPREGYNMSDHIGQYCEFKILTGQ